MKVGWDWRVVVGFRWLRWWWGALRRFVEAFPPRNRGRLSSLFFDLADVSMGFGGMGMGDEAQSTSVGRKVNNGSEVEN